MPKFQVIIDKERCKSCGYCVKFCPQKILKIDSTFNSKSYHPAIVEDIKKCKGCKICALVCPEAAIELFQLVEEVPNEEINDR